MAIAGLQNISLLDSSLHRESQPPLSRRWGNPNSPRTKASSLLKKWRERESEHVVSHSKPRVGDGQLAQKTGGSNTDHLNTFLTLRQDSENGDNLEDVYETESDCQTWSGSQMGLQNGQKDGNSSDSEHSSDFGEVERERVREIFRKWMKNAVKGHSADDSHVKSYSEAQWLGENECEKVRIVRDWIRMTSQQRGTCDGSREEQAAKIGAQIELVCNGFVVNRCEVSTQNNIQKLRGRQALIDLLARAERQRQRELQDLLKCRLVSDFAHRNRIQSLLRGRFLRCGRLVQDERPSSAAASELGLLKQRLTVAGLREEFLSKLDNFVHSSSSRAQSDASSNDEVSDFRNERTQTNNSQVDLVAIQEQSSKPDNSETQINQLCTVPLADNTCQDINWQEATAHNDQKMGIFVNQERERIPSYSSVSMGKRDGLGENADRNWGGNAANPLSQVGNEVKEQHHPLGGYDEEHDVHASLNQAAGHESNTIDGMHWPHTSAVAEEWKEPIIDNDSDWLQVDSVESTGCRDDTTEDTGGNWSERNANQWFQETSGSEGEDDHRLREWHNNGPQEATENLTVGPCAWQATPVGRKNTYYFSDDDSVCRSEIRELLSRRSVSNLLQSDFRESLDQLIQSYVERQAQTSVDWELNGMMTPSPPSSSALMEQEVQHSVGQHQGRSGFDVRLPLLRSPPPITPLQPFWDQELQEINRPQNNLHQCLGIEWEVINDLRIDMARLQQQMNNMHPQSCMEMQLELQRSIRQEVSAAPNRSARSIDAGASAHVLNVQTNWSKAEESAQPAEAL